MVAPALQVVLDACCWAVVIDKSLNAYVLELNAERLAREDGRGRFAEQRKIDMETFGGAGMARRHQGARGGYRGGRGGQQQGQSRGQNYQNGPARGQGQSYQSGPARGQGYQNGSGRGGRGQGYHNAVTREISQGPGQGGVGSGGFQTVPSRGGYRGSGNAPRVSHLLFLQS